VAETVLDATRLVGRPIFFSLAIIILAFLPVFALTGQEGKLLPTRWRYTKTFSMIGATILSVTLVPVLCSLFIGGTVRGEEHKSVMRPLVWLYGPCSAFALRQPASRPSASRCWSSPGPSRSSPGSDGSSCRR